MEQKHEDMARKLREMGQMHDVDGVKPQDAQCTLRTLEDRLADMKSRHANLVGRLLIVEILLRTVCLFFL